MTGDYNPQESQRWQIDGFALQDQAWQRGTQPGTAQFAPPFTAGPISAPPAPPTPRRKSKGPLIAGLIALAVLVVGGIVGANAALGPVPAAPLLASKPPPYLPSTAPANPQPTSSPSLAGFHLTVKTTKKDCFGSAGCLIEFQIVLTYDGPPASPDSRWDVTYDVTGGTDPQTGTLNVQFGPDGVHGDYQQDGYQATQTAKSSAKLAAVVTAVAPS